MQYSKETVQNFSFCTVFFLSFCHFPRLPVSDIRKKGGSFFGACFLVINGIYCDQSERVSALPGKQSFNLK